MGIRTSISEHEWIQVMARSCISALNLLLVICFLAGCSQTPQISRTSDLEAINTPPVPTMKPSLTVAEVPSQISPTQTTISTQGQERELGIDLRIAYPIFTSSEEISTTIMMIDEPYLEPELIYKLPQDTSLASHLSWSNKGDRIAFLIRNGNVRVELCVLTVRNKNLQCIQLDQKLLETKQIIYSIQWSLDDQWVGFPTRNYSENFEQSISYLIDLQSQTVYSLEGIEFSAWLPNSFSSFLALKLITDPNQLEASLTTSIVVVRIPDMEIVHAIEDMGSFAPNIWFDIIPHPDGKSAVSVNHDTNIKTTFIEIDLDDQLWSEMTTIDHSYTPDNFSPNGEWLVITSIGGNTYFWDTKLIDPTGGGPIKQQNEFTYMRFWTKDGHYLVYVDGDQIYRVKPTMPEEAELVIDLTFLGISDGPYHSFSVVEIDP